jgi:hypothetical protein
MKSILSSLIIGCSLVTGCVNNANKDVKDKATKIQRSIFTPSGDWGGSIEYAYGMDGKLRHMTYTFSTFSGYDKALDDFRQTDCVRIYEVSNAGDLILISKVTTDNKTKQKVDRSFYEPEFKHWMTLDEARTGLKEEQDDPSIGG